MEADLVECYWVHTPELLSERMAEIVALYPGRIESLELCKNNVGDSVPGFRMGGGPTHVFLLGREHGHEPVGPCGLTALVEGLANASVPGTGEAFPEAAEILEGLTLHLFPLMNPDGARRFGSQIPESFPGTHLRYCQEDSDRYRVIQCEPGLYLDKPRPCHFSAEDMAIWRKTGKPIGSMFTEDGVELWQDWEHDKAPQTRALKEQMRSFPPELFVDIHAWQCPTSVMIPKMGADETARHEALAGLHYNSLSAADLPFISDGRVTDLGGDTRLSPEWVHKTFGAAAFLYEVHNGYVWYQPGVNVELPVLTQEQIILSVWYGITALLKGILS